MKKICKLFFKCIFVLIPFFAICIYAKANPLGYMDSEAPYYIWNREFVNSVQLIPYNVVILGDSSANAAYMPKILSTHSINLSLGGTTPVENYYTLQDWLQTNSAPTDIFISFQDFHLNRFDCFWTRTMYSHRYKLRQNLEMLQAGMKYKESSMLTEGYLSDFIEYELFLPSKYITPLLNAGFNQRLESNLTAIEEDDLHFGRYIGRGDVEYSGTVPVCDSFEVGEMFDVYYRKILELCQENHITVHIIKLPALESTILTEAYKKQVESYYNGLAESYYNVDFEWCDDFYEQKYFYDATHLNTHGALRFSSDLKKKYHKLF